MPAKLHHVKPQHPVLRVLEISFIEHILFEQEIQFLRSHTAGRFIKQSCECAHKKIGVWHRCKCAARECRKSTVLIGDITFRFIGGFMSLLKENSTKAGISNNQGMLGVDILQVIAQFTNGEIIFSLSFTASFGNQNPDFPSVSPCPE